MLVNNGIIENEINWSWGYVCLSTCLSISVSFKLLTFHSIGRKISKLSWTAIINRINFPDGVHTYRSVI